MPTFKARHGGEGEEHEIALERVKLMVGGPHEDQVGDDRHEHACGACTMAPEDVVLGNIALEAVTLQDLFGLQLSMVGIHDEPLFGFLPHASITSGGENCIEVVLVHVEVSIYQQFPLYGESH